MARWSDPSQGLDNDRFQVWDENLDLYAHLEMAANWDTVDAILGKPADGSPWPPMSECGLGKGIYKIIELLKREQPGLGELKWVWTPQGAPFDITSWQAKGFELANGQTISAGNHHFPGISAQPIKLPQILNRTVVGADPAKDIGTAGSATNSSSGAPGVVAFDGVNNQGEGGTNNQSISVPVPSHDHGLNEHSHVVPAHAHAFPHEHWATEFTGGTRISGIVYEFNDSAIYQKYSIPPGVMYHESFGLSQAWGLLPFGADVKNAPIGRNQIAGLQHYHDTAYTGAVDGRMATSGPKAPIGGATGFDKNTAPAPDTPSTTAQPATATSGVSGGAGSTQAGGAVTINVPNVDNRMLHVGMIPLIKVRNVTSL